MLVHSPMKLRILLTGGGSGGHIYALIAIAEELKKWARENGVEFKLSYAGDAGHYTLNLESLGVHIIYVTASKLRRYFSFQNIIDGIKFFCSIIQALWKIFWLMPDIIISKGGPGALAVLLAGYIYRIPIIIHDSDAIPGLTSIISGRFADIIELAFDNAKKYFVHQERARIVGNPIRNAVLLNDKDRSTEGKIWAKTTLEFNTNEPVIVIIGGSQGATILNNFVLNNINALAKYQILHQVGVDNFDDFIHLVHSTKRYHPVPFLERDLKTAFQAADLIISRAGAGAIFEIAAAGAPSIIVPLATSANNHQFENAYQYKNAGACLVVEEENLIGDIVISLIDEILGNVDRFKKMKENALKFYRPEAAATIANDAFNIILKIK